MEWAYLFYLWGLLINITNAMDNFTFTYEMALRCKKHICLQGYNYDTFYRLDAKDLSHLTRTSKIALEMHIAIQASSNGHFLLSPTPNPSSIDPVYEIVVGGGGNKFTELRRNLRRNARSSVKTPGILSTIDLRAFYIRISEDGLIEFGREGDALPLISYSDVVPLEIKYFSFAAWNGVEAIFLYDCPVPGDSSGYVPNSQEIVPKLSNSDELKRTLLMARLPSVPPASTVPVRIGLRFVQIKYDPFEAKLTTRVAVVMSWTDDSMAWNPSKFNGTTKLKFRQGQIWRPKFFVLNSDSQNAFDTKNADLISMVYSGEATFHFQTAINTLCFVPGGEKWPHDSYNCSLIIQPWEAYEKITLDVLTQNDTKMSVFADVDYLVRSEWGGSVSISVLKSQDWKIGFNEINQSDRMLIYVALERRGSAYSMAFYTPLIVLVTFVLMSFWNEPLTLSRVWFYAGTAVIISMGLCYIDYLIPCHTVPSILVLYITVLIGVLIALFTQVILMTNMMDRVTKSPQMQTVLTAAVFRSVFCLPTIKTCNTYESINEAYASQEDDDSGYMVTSRNGNVEEMDSDNNTYGDKSELAVVIDKVMFVIYSMVFAGMLAAHY